MSRDITDGLYYSEVFGTGDWQSRLPDVLQAGRMNMAGEPVID